MCGENAENLSAFEPGGGRGGGDVGVKLGPYPLLWPCNPPVEGAGRHPRK